MQTIAEAYEVKDGERWWGTGDYEPLLKSFGYEIVYQEDEPGYQGDSFVLFRNGDQWGHLNFGWGSCSGCDSLQACGSDLKKIESLRDELNDSIVWDTRENLAIYFDTHDWAGDYVWSSGTFQTYLKAAKEILNAAE
jgi:hypothetical protein